MKKLLLILAAALCLAACEDKAGFKFDNIYEDPDIFDMPLRMEKPTLVTNDGATFKIMLRTKESITTRGIVVAEDSYSQYPEIVYSDETGNVFEVALSGLRSGTIYYARAFCVTEKGEVLWSLEQEFTTQGVKDNWVTVTSAIEEGYLEYEDGYYIDSHGNRYKYAFVWSASVAISPDVDDSQIAEVGYEHDGTYQPLSRTWPFAGQTYTKKHVAYNNDGKVEAVFRGYIRYKDNHFIYSDFHHLIMTAK